MFKKGFFISMICALCLCACGFNETVERLIKKIDRTIESENILSKKTNETEAPKEIGQRPVSIQNSGGAALGETYQTLDISLLDAIAETERSQGYAPGLGLSESVFRENGGDLAGAVIAAYKDLAWAYSFNKFQNSASIQVTKKSIEDGIRKVKELYSKENKPDISEAKRIEALNAADAVIYFIREDYKKSAALLSGLFRNEEEPDAFSRWMLLVCEMEDGGADRSKQARYAAIQARYSGFPAYWHFGARNFSGALAADYAERCINIFPDGPYAAECRNVLAVFVGLNPSDGKIIFSRNEIKQIINDSIKDYDPEQLSPLIPLISLKDNPYTVFASGAMRELAADKKYKTWFEKQAVFAKKSYGENSFLASRLNYIARG
ncbi:MAG: hypothetical protein LBC27_07915 [Spirochaetaceae bacterium]|nr:hypothetical protein [Spirochaetaceae bacterium]